MNALSVDVLQQAALVLGSVSVGYWLGAVNERAAKYWRLRFKRRAKR